MKCVPKLDHKYWLAIVIASVFGANMGDYLADSLDLGHVNGIPALAAVFAVILLADAFIGVSTALFYWAAIITVRAAATNIGDAFHDWGMTFTASIPLVLALFLLSIAVWRAIKKDVMKNGTLPVGINYWITMFLAGVLGTLVGDYFSFGIRLLPFNAMLVLGAVLAVMLFIGRNGLLKQLFYFWLTIAMVRSAGTAAGDFIAHSIGLGIATAITGAVFAAVVIAFYGTSRKHVVLKSEMLAADSAT